MWADWGGRAELELRLGAAKELMDTMMGPAAEAEAETEALCRIDVRKTCPRAQSS